MKDFTLKKYLELCFFLKKQDYIFLTVNGYLETKAIGKLPKKFVIIRHDVDRWIKNAVFMAEGEYNIGVSSTYYFRVPYTFKPSDIQYISKLHHEIGYHYEVVSKNHGDLNKAIIQFEEELNQLRKIISIQTICMHGNPLSPYDNRSIWNTYCFSDYGIIGEAYLSLSDLIYFTDTGRTWASNRTIYDSFSVSTSQEKLVYTQDLTEWIEGNLPPNLYLTIHPERWAYSPMMFFFSYCMDLVVNIGKSFIIKMRL